MYNNNNDKVTSFLYSWPVIIFAFFFFWPIGFVLLIKRFSTDKTAAMSSSSAVLKVLGIIMVVFGVIGLAANIENIDAMTCVMVAFFIGGGVLLLRKSSKIKKEGNEIRKYISVIVNHNVRDIDSISKAMGKTYEKARADVQNLIDKGFLKNAYIDEQIKQIVLASDSFVNNAVNRAQEQARADLRPRVVTCKCCGAINTITGPVGQCEYCDSPIQ
jgi:hypothetical protein